MTNNSKKQAVLLAKEIGNASAAKESCYFVLLYNKIFIFFNTFI